MILGDGKVIWNRSLGAAYRCMGISVETGYAQATPGQFVMLKVDDGYAPLLRRPFSIHRLIQEGGKVAGIELLYKIVGPTTHQMGTLASGDSLSLLGPLGRGYTLPREPINVALAGGGIGIAPLIFLAAHMLQAGYDPDLIRVYLGGRSAPDLLCVADFEKMGLQVYTTTDDGSAGEKGLVTMPLERSLAARDVQSLYACGPVGMLQGLAALADRFQVDCQVSVETIMACGMGACMGCAVKSTDTLDEECRHACLDGPVFEARRIILEHC